MAGGLRRGAGGLLFRRWGDYGILLVQFACSCMLDGFDEKCVDRGAARDRVLIVCRSSSSMFLKHMGE